MFRKNVKNKVILGLNPLDLQSCKSQKLHIRLRKANCTLSHL